METRWAACKQRTSVQVELSFRNFLEMLKCKEESPMKARVNDGCISCGMCIGTCPEVFRFNDEGVAEAYADVAPEYEETAAQARDDCPVSVIDLE